MRTLEVRSPAVGALLVIGAHADDVEIGCGGTILALLRSNPDLQVVWVVLAATGARADEARASARAFLGEERQADVEVHAFPDGYLPSRHGDVKDVFEDLKARVDPGLVLTHTRVDAHQDHRLACELTWNTFRDHLILEYEVPKWDGDLGRPNVYVPIGKDLAERKADLIAEQFPSQSGKHWFDRETFLGLMRLRGVECGARYAEGFVGRKVLIGI
jgi:LmbE family N-acetylglucosaminyl deacetylase